MAGNPAPVLGVSQDHSCAGQCCPGLGSVPHHPLDRCPLRAEHVPEHESVSPREAVVCACPGWLSVGQEVAGKFAVARQPPPFEARAESPREGFLCFFSVTITLNSPLRLGPLGGVGLVGEAGRGEIGSEPCGVCVCVHVCVPPRLSQATSLELIGGSWTGQAEWGQGQRCSDLCE